MPFMFYTFYELYTVIHSSPKITNQSASLLCVDVITIAAKRNPCFVLNKILSVS